MKTIVYRDICDHSHRTYKQYVPSIQRIENGQLTLFNPKKNDRIAEALNSLKGLTNIIVYYAIIRYGNYAKLKRLFIRRL